MRTNNAFRKAGFALVIILLAAATLTIYSCRDQLRETATGPIPEKNLIPSSQSMSYQDFIKELKGWNDQRYFNHLRPGSSNRTSSKSPFYYEPKPSQRDSVRRISINGHTTYTIVMEPMSKSTPIFHNLVIDSTAEGVNTIFLTYLPREEWVQDYKRNRKTDFYGKVIASNYLPLPNERENGRTQYKQVCTSVMVLSQVVEHLCCHNMQAHSGCNCPANLQYNIQYLYNQVTTCIDVDIPPIGGMPGGSGGDDGGTIPYPGGGYDPCQGNGLRTSTNPCNPPNPGPQTPVYVANANVQVLLNLAVSKGVNFDNALVPMLNELPQEYIKRIEDLIKIFGATVMININQLHTVITGKGMSDAEKAILNALGDVYPPAMYFLKLLYTANAFAAQQTTAVKYNLCASTCESCRGNAFKHALFLIFNAEIFGFDIAISLAAAHEGNLSGKASQMDKINNAAGAKIYQQFSGTGSTNEWVNRVFSSTLTGQFGMMYLVDDVLTSTNNANPDECQ